MLPDTPGDRFYDEAQLIRHRVEAARNTRLHSEFGARIECGSLAAPTPDNERISWRHCEKDPNSYARMFMTGVLPEEAQRFARWLGPGYDLPTVSEWRTIASSWAQAAPLLPEKCDSLAANVWYKLYEVTRPKTLLDQSLMISNGVMEWVWDDRRERILWLGRPHADFYPNTFRPVQYDPPAPRRALRERLWFCGFRLARRQQ